MKRKRNLKAKINFTNYDFLQFRNFFEGELIFFMPLHEYIYHPN